jgi:PAS domain S-box-containing protein
MENSILEFIDFKKIDTLLKGFHNTTGLAVAIVDLEGVILSQFQWKKLQKDFYLKNPETSKWNTNIKLELTQVEKFHFHKNPNGLVEVTIPILVNEEHFANLFSGYFFFEKPDTLLLEKEAKKYGFDEKEYVDAVNLLPVLSLDEIKNTMTFLIETLHYIFEMAFDKMKEVNLKHILTINKLFLEDIIDNSPALIYVSDIEGKIKLANNKFAKIFQLDKREIIGKYRQEIMPVVIAEQHRNNDIEVIKLKKSIDIEEENIEADGKHFYISQKFPLFDTNGVIHGVGGISTDITAKKRAEEALTKSENKYKSLFNNSVDGILVLTEQSEILELNNKICEILDYSREELLLLKGYEFIHSEDLANKDHATTLEQLQQGKTIISQYRLRKKDGSYIPTELSTKMIADNQFLNIIRDITERKEAEKSLMESEKKLSVIFNNHTDLQLLTSIKNDNEYTVDAINKPYVTTLENFGLTLDIDTVIGKSLKQLNEAIGLNEDYYNMTIAKYKEVARTGKSLNFTENLDIADQIYTSDITITPIMNDQGECQYILYNSHNITEQTRTNRALIESEEKFKQIFLTSPDLVTISQMENGTYIDVNENFVQTSGYSRDEIVGKTSNDINIWTNPKDRSRMLSILNEFGKVENFEAQFTMKSGHIIEGLLSAAILGINNLPHILTITRDISYRKAITEKLVKLSHAVEQSPTLVEITDTKGNIEYVNPKFTETTGYSLEEVVGKNLRILKSGHTTAKEYENLWNTISSGREWRGEFHNKRKDGTLYWEQASISSIKNSEGKITHYLAIKSDITEKKKIVDELIKTKEKAVESDRLKSAFLANMSHEIRTPMNGILGFSSLLSEPGLGKEEQQEYIKLIQVSGARMLNLISEIIDISKIESGMMEISLQQVNVNEKVGFVFNLLKLDAEEKSIQLTCKSIEFPDLYLITDPEKLYAILTNLVKNAIKYTDKGSIEFGYNIKNETVEFFVKDSGIGIPLDRHAAIFERFIQVDITNIQARHGAGLGLAIAKAFVTLLGGEIWLESQEGIGTTFHFTLPLNTQNKEQKLQTSTIRKIGNENASHLISKLKILIADDDAISRKLMSKSVNEFGKEIIEAKNGLEAVEKLKENSDIDLILMDVQMPEMNGYEAIKEIRKLNSDVIIITQSAFGLTGDREKAILAGSNDYITKPIDKNELVLLLNKYFIPLQD